jgi:hypothetical protein
LKEFTKSVVIMGKQNQGKYVGFDSSPVNLLTLLFMKDHIAYNEKDPTHPPRRGGVRRSEDKFLQNSTFLKVPFYPLKS